MTNNEQLAFLDNIEADLATTPAKSRTPGGIRRRIGMGLAMAATGIGFLAMTGTAAHADNPYCGVPNPVTYDHTKYCTALAYYHFEYLGQTTAGPGGQRTCYQFWRTFVDWGCGSDPGRFASVCV
ncbi:hypothetical protein [Fodinicola acaciae]|uniref:hypothetical protein n=1 Tax=Fodinicola acaciae TaxID=2681555 RepID=UPI0013D03329|nr:hypothetical protein [Fodinicola acaciae]